jgi:hypothetical protein
MGSTELAEDRVQQQVFVSKVRPSFFMKTEYKSSRNTLHYGVTYLGL